MSDQNEDGYKAMSAEHQPEEKVFALPATMPRRVFAVVTLGGLGLIHFWILLTTPPVALIGKVFLLAMGAVLLYGTYRLWVSTSRDILMTAEDVREEGGRVLCQIDDIHHVQRGAFAFKPSNGFVIVLNDNMPSRRGWAPGLWWRLGRRIGVGGVTSPGAGKAMADVLAARVVHRRLDEQAET
ncbi:hypothetical protein [Pacificibacter sp. AS14]|uniref:hypothetical protein n=1 Tax=Pacificibacter sp. AS14 TaxID=3135785 RepID=UPI00317C3622